MTTTTVTRPARTAEIGQRLTDAEGRYVRTITDVDFGLNIHGRVVIRTGSGSTIVDPDYPLHFVED